jgi:hypothetical protein
MGSAAAYVRAFTQKFKKRVGGRSDLK